MHKIKGTISCTSASEIIKVLKIQTNKENIIGMARFGIRSRNILGVPMPVLRKMAGTIRRDHGLALDLWDTGIHEARILAGLIGDPEKISEREMERWAGDFDSWAICDQVCSNLFDKTPMAIEKAVAWTRRPEEYVKRAGFVIMAAMAVHDKKAPDSLFIKFLPLLQQGARDERNFVKKAVNWALRQIGKRNIALHEKAMAVAREMETMPNPAARWIARDAIRELCSPDVLARLKRI